MKESVFQSCLERWNNSVEGKPFWAELAKEFGYTSKDSLRNAFNRERKARGIQDRNPSESSEESASYKETDENIYIVYANTTLKTKEDVIREYNIDTSKWKIDLFEVKPSQGYRKDRKVSWHTKDGVVVQGDVEDSGKLVIATMYSLRVRFVPITVQTLTFDDIKTYYETMQYVSSVKFPDFTPSDDCVLDINVGDWHLGARWFDKNSSDVDEIYPKMMSDIFSRIESGGRKFTKIFLNLMGDVAHYTNRRQQTERHQQMMESNGMTPLEIYDLAKNMLIGTVDRLLEYAPVEMLYVPGNHDGDFLYYLLAGLGAWYRSTDTFSVDLEKRNRKARVFGRNLRGWEHGEIQRSNRVHWLANEFGDLWTGNQYRESFSGHLHHEEVIECGGVKTRRLPAIAVTDKWHHDMGFGTSVRASMSFVWEKDRFGWSDIWQSTGV